VAEDEHFLAVAQYVERNALSSQLGAERGTVAMVEFVASHDDFYLPRFGVSSTLTGPSSPEGSSGASWG
jgi:hypothetical protein